MPLAPRPRGERQHARQRRADGTPDRSALSIIGNVPVTITVRVARLHIEIEETRECLGLARRRVGRGWPWDSYTGGVRSPGR